MSAVVGGCYDRTSTWQEVIAVVQEVFTLAEAGSLRPQWLTLVTDEETKSRVLVGSVAWGEDLRLRQEYIHWCALRCASSIAPKDARATLDKFEKVMPSRCWIALWQSLVKYLNGVAVTDISESKRRHCRVSPLSPAETIEHALARCVHQSATNSPRPPLFPASSASSSSSPQSAPPSPVPVVSALMSQRASVLPNNATPAAAQTIRHIDSLHSRKATCRAQLQAHKRQNEEKSSSCSRKKKPALSKTVTS